MAGFPAKWLQVMFQNSGRWQRFAQGKYFYRNTGYKGKNVTLPPSPHLNAIMCFIELEKHAASSPKTSQYRSFRRWPFHIQQRRAIPPQICGGQIPRFTARSHKRRQSFRRCHSFFLLVLEVYAERQRPRRARSDSSIESWVPVWTQPRCYLWRNRRPNPLA